MEQESSVGHLMDSDHQYSSELGSAFQGDSRELLKELPDSSIDLIVTSPPFALQHEKEYGNEDQDGYNDWFLSFIPEVRRVLQPHGSFVVEIALGAGAPHHVRPVAPTHTPNEDRT
jgi:site-specific DNA-methyltransferase (cytosine-N4-specific)